MKRAIIDPEALRIQSAYDAVESECTKKIEIIANQREKLLRTNWRWRLFTFISTLLIFVFIGAVISLSHLISWSWSLLIGIALIYFSPGWIKVQSKRIKSSIGKALHSSTSYLIVQEKIIQSKLDQAEAIYHQECTRYKSYPPDWEWRRKLVLERDQYRCTQCNWPQGTKRRSRELHIHHIISLAKGGDNSLKNLTTLCHICHREVDMQHSLVRKNSRGSWR